MAISTSSVLFACESLYYSYLKKVENDIANISKENDNAGLLVLLETRACLQSSLSLVEEIGAKFDEGILSDSSIEVSLVPGLNHKFRARFELAKIRTCRQLTILTDDLNATTSIDFQAFGVLQASAKEFFGRIVGRIQNIVAEFFDSLGRVFQAVINELDAFGLVRESKKFEFGSKVLTAVSPLPAASALRRFGLKITRIVSYEIEKIITSTRIVWVALIGALKDAPKNFKANPVVNELVDSAIHLIPGVDLRVGLESGKDSFEKLVENARLSLSSSLYGAKRIGTSPQSLMALLVAFSPNFELFESLSEEAALSPIAYVRLVDEAQLEKYGPVDFINTADADTVERLYSKEYGSRDAEMGWESGSYEDCLAGDISNERRQDVLDRINFYRAMTGIKSDVVLDEGFNNLAQHSALVMSANGKSDHWIDEGWDCFTSEAQEAAANSNLYLGRTGVYAIDGYMEDPGEGNKRVGHRQAFLDPAVKKMGVGETEANDKNYRSNTVWVFDDEVGKPGLMRDGFVSWPNSGYVPSSLVFPRWSFSIPDPDQNVNYAISNVRMTQEGRDIPVDVIYGNRSSGHSSKQVIVWEPTLTEEQADNGLFTVEIMDVEVDGRSEKFVYEVSLCESDSGKIDCSDSQQPYKGELPEPSKKSFAALQSQDHCVESNQAVMSERNSTYL